MASTKSLVVTRSYEVALPDYDERQRKKKKTRSLHIKHLFAVEMENFRLLICTHTNPVYLFLHKALSYVLRVMRSSFGFVALTNFLVHHKDYVKRSSDFIVKSDFYSVRVYT